MLNKSNKCKQHHNHHQRQKYQRTFLLSNLFGASTTSSGRQYKWKPKCFKWLQLAFAIISLEIAGDYGFITTMTAAAAPASAPAPTATATPLSPTTPTGAATTAGAPAATITTSATFIGDIKSTSNNDNNATNVILSAFTSVTENENGIGGNIVDGGGQRLRNGQHSTFSLLDKEVVNRLIKKWAPIVWLAPEEKFLPLGVDEFLNHVHSTDKGKNFIPGMPVGDNSKKAYLVTNAEIEELLENENSFIYGRNPNESPVPIYAVVTLCNEHAPAAASTQQQTVQLMSSNTNQQVPQKIFNENDNHFTVLNMQLVQNTQLATPLSSTRGPYIPVSIDPLETRNDTVRRSSRLYPVFKRVRRQEPQIVDATYVPLAPPSIPPLLLNLPPKSMTEPYDLVLGETRIDGIDINTQTAPALTTDAPDNTNGNVNNFIANLVDNVKFSITNNEMDNNINIDNNFDELQIEQLPSHIIKGANHKKVPRFHVTYWMFYPYSQGKTMCTLSLGPLGSIPFPAVYGFCLGRRKDIGSHIGDWEHMSLYFTGEAEPEAMYVSAHDAGAYYSYNRLTGSFEFKKQETRKGILQRPNFPKTVTTFNSHPVLFAAKGSHGLWTAPGKHRFVKVARLYDINGFGTPWNTWKAVEITYENLKSYGRSLIPSWLSFKGKWGNPKSKCHPFRRIGLNFCEYTDGPTGIPLKEPHFQCSAPTYR